MQNGHFSLPRLFILIALPFFLSVSPVLGAAITVQETESVNIYFFWGEGCPYCEVAKPILEEIADQNPRVHLHGFEVYHDAENRDLFFAFCEIYGIEPRAVPTLFVADRNWVGFSDQIQVEISQTIQTCLTSPCTDLGRDIYMPQVAPEPDGLSNGVEIVTTTPQQSTPDGNSGTTLPLIGSVNISKALIFVGGIFGMAIIFIVVDRAILRK